MTDVNLLPVKIIGTGHYIPENILSNETLSKNLNITEDWISSRCGIENRRISSENEFTTDLARKASENALISANISANELDLIIFCTITPNKLCPSSASKLQDELQAINAGGFDLSAACAGFIYGLSIGYQFIATGMYKTILVVASDTMSKVTDYSDKNTAILFGDGAGAVILQRSTENSFKTFSLGLDGTKRDFIEINSLGIEKNDLPPYLTMKGTNVFKWTFNFLPKFILDTLEKANLDLSEIDYFIFHQANKRIIDLIVNKLEIPSEKVLNNIENVGNTSAASIPMILSNSIKEGIIKKNDKLFLISFGAGLSWGGCILEWS